jgi:hypothetical protein
MTKGRNKAILIATYNRVSELAKSLAALNNCLDASSYPVVIIYHEEQAETKNYLQDLPYHNAILIPVDGSNKSKLENINYNRVLGLNYCFNKLGAEFVIAIEDDVVLGYDALIFAEHMIDLYGASDAFRAVNLGSREAYSTDSKHSYGLFRYGLFGQGSAMTARTWKKINELQLLNKFSTVGFDSMIERYIKTGFVIMPYASRYIDLGWNGTHAPKNPLDKYYLDLKNSWVGNDCFPPIPYIKETRPYVWRYDCIKYKSLLNWYYYLLYLIFK